MWQEIFDAVREPLIIFDADGHPVRANPSAYAAFGLPESPLDRHEYERIVEALRLRSVDGRAIPLEEWPSTRALRGETVVSEPFAVTHPAGHDLVVEVTATPMRRDGVIAGAITEWHDVTDRYHAEQALRDGEARYRRLFEHMLEGFGIGEAILDESGAAVDFRFIEMNGAFERQSGLGREILGKPIRQVLPHLERYWVDVYCGVALSGIPQRFEHFNADTNRQYEVFCYSPARGRFAILFRDVSREREVERELRELSQRLTYHVDHSPLAVIEWGPDMRLTRWSGEAERLFGWTAAEVLGKRMEDFRWVYAEDAGQVSSVSADLETGRDSRRFSANRNYRKDGSIVHCEWYNSSLVDEDGNLRSILSLVLDVTARVQLEEELRQQAARLREANRLKDDFLATLSHELRTPLNAILGWAHMLSLGELDAETSRRAARAVYRNAQAQSQLVADVLDVSRIITGKLRLKVAPVSIQEILEAAVESVQAAAEAKALRLHVSGGERAGVIRGDADRLQQVFWNLLSNAVKFTPSGGTITVTIDDASPDVVEVAVRDSGAGIAPDFLPHVFERFTQADSSTTRQHGGLGLGLAIVRHLVELHGGSVHAESEGIGRGATFRVRLPARPAEGSLAGGKAEAVFDDRPPAPGDVDLAGVRVLLVDDEPDGREAAGAMLACSGAIVTMAASAEEGLALVRESRPHVIVADIGMPGMDGYEFLRRVRALGAEEGGTIPAAALTGYGRREDRVRALSAGFQQHVAKPVTPDELLAVVASLAGRS